MAGCGARARVLLLVAMAWPLSARADEASDLYDEGLRLLVAGQTAEACGKLAASRRIREGIGVTLYLADCYERLGRTASAWYTYGEAAVLASERNDGSRAEVAKRRKAALEPRLRHIELTAAAGVEVRRDGQLAERGVATAVDPGVHIFDARAPGKKPWEARVEAPAEGATVRVEVPELAPEAAPVSASPRAAPKTADEGWPTQRWIGLGVGGAGVVTLGVGTVFGAIALSKKAKSDDAGCQANNHCSPDAAQIRDDARSAAAVSTVAFVAGAVLVGVGATLWLTAPRGQASAALGVGPDGVRVTATF